MTESDPPFPPSSSKQRLRRSAWPTIRGNTRDPQRVALAYTTDSGWRNRAERHPEPVDTSTNHVGFRCVVRQAAASR
ncbi:MAG: DUF1348 family protein [Acetobacteraceae bacterium]|nr:DUF1348 family protein [Acetobacteraceae bacterium]